MSTLWLVRHAPVRLPPGICYGASDVPVDPLPTADCAAQLAPLLPAGLAACHSPLSRCHALATELQRRRPDLRIAADPRLAEMDFGHWEGRPWDDIGQAAIDTWMADFAHHPPGGGEPVSRFLARVSQALQDTRANGAHGTLWITHAGVIKAVRWLLAGAGPLTRADQWPTASVACGQWCVVELGAPAPKAG